jgi:hypothetical protein
MNKWQGHRLLCFPEVIRAGQEMRHCVCFASPLYPCDSVSTGPLAFGPGPNSTIQPGLFRKEAGRTCKFLPLA